MARPMHFPAYEFVVVAALRAQQLMRGCVPQLPGDHKPTTMAQMEVAAGKVAGTMPSPTSTVPVVPIL